VRALRMGWDKLLRTKGLRPAPARKPPAKSAVSGTLVSKVTGIFGLCPTK